MQRRHDLEMQSLVLEHLFRQPGGGGVRDGVVDVHQIELLALGDFMLFDRECQRVG